MYQFLTQTFDSCKMSMLYHFFKKNARFPKTFLRICICLVRKIVYKKGILKECIRRYFLHGSIFCLGIYISISKPSICFCKWIISNKWRKKLLIHSINLTGHRKRSCCLQLLLFLEMWVIAPFWHWRTQVFSKGCCQHDLKAFMWNWI